MKKYLKALLLIFMAGIIFTACTGKDQGLPDKNISEINWTLDRMINTEDGKDLSNDIAIKFDDKNFVMTDRNNAIDFTGTYKLEKAGTGYQVIMDFDDFEETVLAGYGMKTEKNKEPVPNLVFDFMGRNYSFIGEEKK
ncbi:hypothetical protein I6I93_03820 [Peptoniphilus harei]|uniref:Uncharacterized protein n=1 Tax=Peptoniphilus harei TaxID=54005 RepID=A0A2X1ZTL8_9FIRM|nr:hypothetical protein [Peptoniphilus harei]QQT91691.1 hypothetical protein I6I93_03820 [Peptoniphilus harei]SPY46666.1 Uncharacterised protein [Peptoniphilus harei]